MRRLLLLVLLCPLFAWGDDDLIPQSPPNFHYFLADNTAYLQNCIATGCTLPTATYNAVSLNVTHNFNMRGSTINFTGTSISMNMSVAGVTLSNGTLIGSSPVYNATLQYGVNMAAASTAIDHVNISNFPTYGVVMGKFSNQTISASTVSNTGYIGISCVNAVGAVTNIHITNNTINRGAQGVGAIQPAIIFRGQGGGTISNSFITGNNWVMPANPTHPEAECIEIRGASLITYSHNNHVGGSIGLSVVQGTIRLRGVRNDFTNQSLESIEIGDSPQCRLDSSTISGGKIGFLLDGSTANVQDTIQNAAITGVSSFPVQANTSAPFALNDVLNNITGTTTTYALDVIRATNLILNNWAFTGNSTQYAIFLDNCTGGITVNSSAFTGFPSRLFFFYKADAPSITTNNVIANLTTINPGIICYSNSSNVSVGANVSCNLAPALPSIAYSPNSYSFLINTAIPPINITSSGGVVTAYSISTPQPSGLLWSTSTARFTGTPLALSPFTSYTVIGSNLSGSDTAVIRIAVVDRIPIISYSPSSQVCTINVAMTPMTPNISLGGAPTNFTVSPALPSNIVLNPTTGVISGTGLSLLSATTFTIFAFNSGGSTSFPVTLSIINPAPVAPNISYLPNTYSLPINVVAPTISPINIGGDANSWAVSPALPTSLNFSTVNGSITGTPDILHTLSDFDISATNITGTSHTTLHLAVVNTPPLAPILSFSPNNITLVQNESAILITPNNSGGAVTPPYSINPALVAGLSFNVTSALISGSPSVTSPAVTYHITGGNITGSSTADITITVVAPNPPPAIFIPHKMGIIVY